MDTGLSLYGGTTARSGTLFGGHDARVCGLSHRGLSEWFAGSRKRDPFGDRGRRLGAETGHVGSIAHADHNQAMLNCYRRDFPALSGAIADFRQLTANHSRPSLAATQIFEGWRLQCRRARARQEKIRQGLAVHGELQTPEDEPVYCGMLGELLAHTGGVEDALELLSGGGAGRTGGTVTGSRSCTIGEPGCSGFGAEHRTSPLPSQGALR